jgi:CheY-like chemotaxis protein
MLTRKRHEVVLAQDGREAVACFLQVGFDVILMDVQMPELRQAGTCPSLL